MEKNFTAKIVKLINTPNTPVKAVATLMFDNKFLVMNILLVKNSKTGEMMVRYPIDHSRNTPDKKSITNVAFPVDAEYAREIKAELLKAYVQAEASNDYSIKIVA